MLGDANNTNKKFDSNKNQPTVYSKYAFTNVDSTVEKSKITFTFLLNGLLKIAIAPMISNKGAFPEWDYKNEGAIYITHMKANMLAKSITNFLANRGAFTNIGVNSSDGIIYICDGSEFGIDNTCIVIKKVNESGSVVSTFFYEINKNYHFNIVNFDGKTAKFDREYFNDIELELFMNLLEEFSLKMSGASAYANIEYNRFNTASMKGALDDICNHLGIQRQSGGYNRQPKNSYFSNNSQQSESSNQQYSKADVVSGTLDDIDI